MMRPALVGVLLLACGCASAPRPGPTPEGVAVTVHARDKAGARRQAIESLLPLFLTPEARREKSATINEAVYSKMKPFIGYQKLSKKGDSLVEIKIDPLSAALGSAGLIRPPGYKSGPEELLLAIGSRAVGPTGTERFAAGALETALFGRGVQAQDADDEIVKLKNPITAKTEAALVSQAAAGGWSALATGGVSNVARYEPQSKSWRGRARYSLSLYGVSGTTEPVRLDADGEALNVSSFSAVSDAIEAAAQAAALRMDGLISHKRVGRATIGILVSGYRDPVFLNRVLADLRSVEGVEAASLISWHEEDLALIHAFATTLTAETLAGKLINAYPDLRITAIENEDGRITIVGPEIPAAADMGQE